MSEIRPEKLKRVVATDCGSTTTKAILFEKKPEGWRQTFRGEAPTTVEKPLADVTIGATNAFTELQEISGTKLLKDERNGQCPLAIRDSDEKEGVDLYVSTSSAGGGLQMVVGGSVSTITSESAERAALGAGAIVMDTLSIDDGREPFERVQKIRHLRPDIVLLAGGVDGGNTALPLELAETILQADPRPRFGETLSLPVIYAANKESRHDAEEILAKQFDFVPVDNLRPSIEEENLAPARDAVHELFLHHVMSHAPGYSKLLSWSPVPIIPTPAGVGEMVQQASAKWGMEILAVDIGGATTDVFSVFKSGEESVFNRTVSANLGMSYSVANVLLEAGVEAIKRWIPFSIEEDEIRDRLRNKMIRPTSIPQSMEDLLLEQAVCREALSLALHHHKRLAVGLSGKKQSGRLGSALSISGGQSNLVNMLSLDLIIGSGGVLSHAPNRNSTALMMLDAYEPMGVTQLAVDSIFMMPHLGVFSTVHPEAASEIFIRDCIIGLGTVIAPNVSLKPGRPLLKVIRDSEEITLHQGELKRFDLEQGQVEEVTIKPLSSRINLGDGFGKTVNAKLHGGQAGVILDGRGRPLPRNTPAEVVASWFKTLGLEVS